MTFEEYIQSLKDNDERVASEHLTEEEIDKEFADFINKNHCKIKR